jgi:DNA polymerase-4
VTDAPDPPPRKIIHIDMDAFYASVEQRDDPELRGKPVAVGGTSMRGVVAAASYEARKYGVRSAMASVTARRRCPDLIFVKPRFEVYRAISQEIRAIFADYTDLIEPLSLDEAYLDVSEDRRGVGSATAIAQEIRARIRSETGLTASAGVSYNKFIAKLASDHNKPDGLCVITPKEGAAYVASLPVRRFHGVGPVTASKMERLGIFTGADLAAKDLAFLQANFGSWADYLYRACRGVDDRPVRSNRIRKSLGAERTFFEDIFEPEALHAALEPIVEEVWRRAEKAEVRGKTVTLKAKYANFEQVTRARTLNMPVADKATLAAAGAALLDGLIPVRLSIRLLGLTLSHFAGEEEPPAEDQPSLF